MITGFLAITLCYFSDTYCICSASLCACLQCHNRVMFKQFLQASALQFVQIDSCRVGSVNENLAIILMAAKFNGKSNVDIISKSLI